MYRYAMPPPRDPTPHPHPIYVWLERELEKRDMAWVELCRRTKMSTSTFHRWRDRKINPSIPMIRKVADVLGYTSRERLRIYVIAEILTPEEAGAAQSPSTVPEPGLLTDEELISEVKRRMRRGRVSQ